MGVTQKKVPDIYVYPRGAYILLLYSTLSFALFTNGLSYGPVVNRVLEFQVSEAHYYGLLVLLLFPFIGLIGEIFSRFKLVNIGVILIVLGKLYFRILALFESFSSNFLNVSARILLCIGVGLFITNIFSIWIRSVLV